MERLGTVDSLFLDVERSGPSVAVGAVTELAGAPPTLAELRAFVADRLPGMPRFRQRVEESRTKVRSAKWVEVEPDLTYHIRAVELEGKSRDEAVSRLMEDPMDRDRPLWDITMMTGYSDTQWSLIIRLHHSIADGQGALILIGHLIDMTPQGDFTLADALATSQSDHDEAEEDLPASGLEAITTNITKSVETGFEVVGQFISTYPDTVRALADLAPKPPSDLGGMVSARRKWIGGHYPLDKVKAARKAYPGVTINDLVLASVAMGFTALLESRGENCDGRTLRAVMPVTLRSDMSANNQVGILPAPLPLGEMDPMKRMKLIRKATKRSKRSMLPKITDEVARTVGKATPSAIKQQVVNHSGAASQYFAETLVTNVPGPRTPLFFMGRQVVSQIPIIPIEGSMRIIVGITSYVNDLNIGITGDGENATDVDVLLEGITSGMDELVDRAAGSREP